jgi:hypothetical protein
VFEPIRDHWMIALWIIVGGAIVAWLIAIRPR